MPYGTNKELPPAVKKLPAAAQNMFRETFNKVYTTKKNEATAFAIAWGAVKKRLKHTKGKYVALSEAFVQPSWYEFEVLPDDGDKLIINAVGDEITFEGVLATTGYFMQNGMPSSKARFSESALKDIADQINRNGSTTPDVDHAVMTKLAKQYGKHHQLIINAMKEQKGFIKSIQAVYREGKLWIKGVLNSTYKNIMNVVKGMSIEAISDSIEGDTITKANYLGFTFAVKNTPKLPDAVVTRVAVA